MNTEIYSAKGRRTKQGDNFTKLLGIGFGKHGDIKNYSVTVENKVIDNKSRIRIEFTEEEKARIINHWLNH